MLEIEEFVTHILRPIQHHIRISLRFLCSLRDTATEQAEQHTPVSLLSPDLVHTIYQMLFNILTTTVYKT